MRRGSILQVGLIAAILGGIAAAIALVPRWLPADSSRQAGRIDFVFWFVTVISICIFSLVTALIIYSALRFGAKPDDDSDGPPIHGHTGLEIVWTAIPALIVTVIAVVSAVVLSRNGNAGTNPLRVDVTSQQFAWSFSYPQQGNVTSGTLRLPLRRPVKLYFHSKDVIHSFWVPEFGQKQDNVPGITTTIVITPDRLGTFPVICTELCGLGHSLMRTQAIVMPPDKFDAWIKGQQGAVSTGGATGGKAVFLANPCGSCHTFKPAGSSANVGPDLDKLPQYARQAGQPLESFVRTSIVNPNAYIQPGYHPNIMPSFATLPKSQLDALVAFLIGGKK